MKVLLLNQFFWPDSSATSQLLTDLARALESDGHEVTVICAGGGDYAIKAEAGAGPKVKVYRVKALPFVRGTLGRVLSYASFYLSAALRGLLLSRQNIVLTLTTPPLLSVLGSLIKWFRGSQHYIWEMDVYPDVAVDLRYFKAGGPADRVTGLLADLSRRYADGVIALGSCMKARLERRGIDPARILVAENWADGTSIQPLPRKGKPDELVILYSGNLGLAHDLGTVLGAIKTLKDDRRFRFLFVGNGGRRQELADFISANNISSVELRPYVQRESLSESLAAGDIGLVTQQESCCGSVVPSKVYGLLAAGRPILFIGPAEATPARIIALYGCGWHIRNGDSKELTRLLNHLALHREEVIAAGVLARQALLNHFDLPHGVARILSVIGADRPEGTKLPVYSPKTQAPMDTVSLS